MSFFFLLALLAVPVIILVVITYMKSPRLGLRISIGLFVTLLATVIILFRPVCVPIPNEHLKSFNVPIEERNDRALYLKVFQKKNGQWYHCMPWIYRLYH